MFKNINSRICTFLHKFINDKRGVTAIEYALIAVAISSMLFIVLGTGGEDGLTAKIKQAFSSIQDGLSIQNSASSAGSGGGN